VNILQLVSGTGVNGAVRHCYDLSGELAARGHHVLLGHKPGAWIAQQPVPTGVELLSVSLKRRPAELRRAAEIMKERKIDVIHTHNSSAHFFGALLSLFYGFPRVATSHATFFQPHWWMADRIIAPSEATANFQRRVNLVPRSRIDVIPNFINVARLQSTRSRGDMRRELGIGDNAFVIITVGELIPRKNQELLVQAVPDLLAGGITPVVLLAGKCDPSYRRKVDARIKTVKIEDQVRLLGERSDIPDLLLAADCFCLPSRHEILPIALLEAMALGLPVVATNVGGVAELVRDGIDGFITKSEDKDALAAALLRLARDPDLRTRMSRAARNHVRSSYTPDVCVAKILASYHDAIRRRGRDRG
jgi:glycosyltransferase involved in cell wall biosynthesis